MTNMAIYKTIILYLDAKHNQYWIFHSNETEKGFSVLALPAVKFDVATTDSKTLMEAALELMKLCKFVNSDDARREFKEQFKEATGLASIISLERVSIVRIGISQNNEKFEFSIYETKGRKNGLRKIGYFYPDNTSLDDLAVALQKVIDEALADAQK